MTEGGRGGPRGGVALTVGRIIDLLFAAEIGVFALYEVLKPGCAFGVSGKADRSRGVPFIVTCGSQTSQTMPLSGFDITYRLLLLQCRVRKR